MGERERERESGGREPRCIIWYGQYGSVGSGPYTATAQPSREYHDDINGAVLHVSTVFSLVFGAERRGGVSGE